MTIRLDHTIVRARDKIGAAEFFAEIFGLTVKRGHFAEVQINESLTFAFADEAELWGGPGFDPNSGQSHHYAFHVSEAEFDAISIGSSPRESLMAAAPSATVTAKLILAVVGVASISKIRTVICSK